MIFKFSLIDRQHIKAFFNLICGFKEFLHARNLLHGAIQCYQVEQLTASKVRSCNGLMVHVFGKLAAAMFFWYFLRDSS
jgi:hypothetical protein